MFLGSLIWAWRRLSVPSSMMRALFNSEPSTVTSRQGPIGEVANMYAWLTGYMITGVQTIAQIVRSIAPTTYFWIGWSLTIVQHTVLELLL